ncbi:MAG: sulfur oxidation c-type cytochrome SoxA [Gammaproteobacteria bacterium]|nr:sulfur oxidation c-type cytochrome SoxA [Gammaproteobacteria bacterium]
MNKKVILLLAGLGIALGAPITASATPQDDLKQFQAFYKKRFPTVPLEAYTDGVNVLPQYADQVENWNLLMEFPPYEMEVDKAQELWSTPFANGKTYSSCFKNGAKGLAVGYPFYDKVSKKLRTVVTDINECRVRNGEKPIKNLKYGDMARLVIAFKMLSNGQKMAVKLNSPEAIAAYEKGKQFYWARRGQLNFSCASCHVQNAGNKIRGNVLGAGLGHGVGFPVYRTKWSLKGKPLGTLHRRYGGCNKQVRAKPLKPQSEAYKNLELYEAYMNTGIPIRVPSQRM